MEEMTPKLFSISMKLLEGFVEGFGVWCQQYADDTQQYFCVCHQRPGFILHNLLIDGCGDVGQGFLGGGYVLGCLIIYVIACLWWSKWPNCYQ